MPCAVDLSIAMLTCCSSSTVVACINSAAFMGHSPVLTSNLHPVFEVQPLRQYYLRVKVRTQTPSVTKWRLNFRLSFLYVAKSSAHGLFRCIPSIYHVNTLFILLFIYLLIDLFIHIIFVYLLKTHQFIVYLFLVYNLRKKRTSIDLVRCCWSSKKMFICMKL